jgi:hypothetical protein
MRDVHGRAELFPRAGYRQSGLHEVWYGVAVRFIICVYHVALFLRGSWIHRTPSFLQESGRALSKRRAALSYLRRHAVEGRALATVATRFIISHEE